MKEKVKNYLFCLCALAMCLMFALAVFFKGSNSKAAFLFEGGDMTVNEGQSLIADTTQGRFIGQLNYNGSKYEFSYFKYSDTAPTYIIYLTSCSVQSSTYSSIVLKCNFGSYSSMDSSRTSAISNFVIPTLTISKSDISNANDTLTINSFTYSSGGLTIPNVVFTTRGISYSDGYNVGYNNAKLQLANELYYYACMQNLNYIGVCSSSYFTPSSSTSLAPTSSYILQEVLVVAGSNSSAVPVGVYDYVKTKYESTYNICLSYSLVCSSWSSNSLTIDNLQTGIDVIQSNLDLVAYYTSFSDGYEYGRLDGIAAGVEEGKTIGYSQGFIDGQDAQDIVGNAVLSVASTPLMILSGMLNFDIFGFNVLGLVLGLFTFILVLWILKKVF